MKLMGGSVCGSHKLKKDMVEPISLMILAGFAAFSGLVAMDKQHVVAEQRQMLAEQQKQLQQLEQRAKKPRPLRSCFQDCAEDWQRECRSFGVDVRNANLAVLGRSGSGKSSAVNALLGITDKDPDAAPVGYLETTDAHQKYNWDRSLNFQSGENLSLVVHDFPGCGTTGVPCTSYIETYKLDCYDTILLVLDTRVDDDSLRLVKRLSEAFDRRVYVLRNKILQDVQQEQRRQGGDFVSVFERVEQNIIRDLRVQFGKNAHVAASDTSDPDLFAPFRAQIMHYFGTNRRQVANMQ